MRLIIGILIIAGVSIFEPSCKSNQGVTNKTFYSKNKPSRKMKKEDLKHQKRLSKKNEKRLRKFRTKP